MIELRGFPIEIERKWILRRDPLLLQLADHYYFIHQKYAEDGWRYREQIEIEWDGVNPKFTDRIRYFKTLKTPVGIGANEEEEYEITKSEFENCGPVIKGIKKFRHVYKYGELKFEVDVFLTIHLVILEVELKSLNQKFEMPDFLNDLLLYEVTGKKEFNNSSLSSVIF